MDELKDLRIVDNFYQTSAFFPMPTILVGTISENGMTNLGSYSLCFPYYIAGKDYYAMLLECRNSSNTAQNILRNKTVSLNFIPDKRKYFREAVRLGFPGETTEQKMKDCLFTLRKGEAEGRRPEIVEESFQVFECTWDDSLEQAYEDKAGNLEGYDPPYRSFNGITSKFGAHFILKIDKILMKEKYRNAIVDGVKAGAFPAVPVDYGYRDSTHQFLVHEIPPPDTREDTGERGGRAVGDIRGFEDRSRGEIHRRSLRQTYQDTARIPESGFDADGGDSEERRHKRYRRSGARRYQRQAQRGEET